MKQHGDRDPLPRLVYLTSLVLQQHADRLLLPFGLTLEQLHPLKILFLEGGTLGQRQLCTLAAKSPANMTRILDRLAKKGFIRRQPDPGDRRAFVVEITRDGIAMVEEAGQLFAGYLDRAMAGVSEEEEEVCRRVLARLAGNVGSL